MKHTDGMQLSAFTRDVAEEKGLSPSILLIITILAIVLAEAVEMTILAFLHLPAWWMDMVFDVIIMLMVITPILYYLPYRSLMAEISMRKKGEHLLRIVLENLPVGVVITDKAGHVLHGNRESINIWSELRKVGPEEYGQYKAWWVKDGKPVKAEEWGAYRAIRYGETSFNEEVEIETFDGERKTILNSAAPFHDDHNTLQGAVVVNQDITSRRKTEKELQHNYELMERYFSSISTLMAYMDRDFNFIRVNEAYARSAGHPLEFFPGKNHFDLYPHEENQQIFRRVVETGQPFFVLEKPFEYAEFPEKGVTYWDWSLQPVHDGDGTVQGLVLSLVDVTERKLAEMQLDAQNQELLALTATERHQRQLAEGLVHASIAVNASLKLEEVLEQILISLQTSLPYKLANILLVEGENLYFAQQCEPGNEKSQKISPNIPFKLRDLPILEQVYQTQQPRAIPDVMLLDGWNPLPGMEWTRSYLISPLIIGHEVTGMITLRCDQPGMYNDESVHRLTAFAAPAAVAIQNARLYSAELHARVFAETLSEASQALTQSIDLNTVMNTLLDYLYRLVPYDGAMIAQLQDDMTLKTWAVRRNDPQIFSKLAESAIIDLWDRPFLKEIINSCSSLILTDQEASLLPEDSSEIETVRSRVGIPLVAGDKPIGVVVLAKMEPDYFHKQQLQIPEAIIAQAAMVMQNAWLYEQVRIGHLQLQSLYHRLVEVQENERKYVARELHDDTSQALASTMIGLRLLEEDETLPENLRKRVSIQNKVIDRVLENLHRLAMDLHPATLDLLGLVATLEQLVKDLNEHYDINIQFKCSGISTSDRLSSEIETTIYRIVQEALNNVVLHAKTNNVDLILENRGDKIIAIVEDDGIGYDPTKVHSGGHLGLIGMQERAQMAGGTLQIESRPGAGTTIVVELPNDN